MRYHCKALLVQEQDLEHCRWSQIHCQHTAMTPYISARPGNQKVIDRMTVSFQPDSQTGKRYQNGGSTLLIFNKTTRTLNGKTRAHAFFSALSAA
ncbi:MAG: hypothetical protein CSA26_07100 [Desulfobacterales bacterium]|nr:MAG: hypothetical protein CSA26_07100 [Desulfobacterales bacterium]